MAHDAQPASAADRVRLVGIRAEVRGDGVEPRLAQRRLEHLEQRPGRALGQPRIALGIDARRRRDRVADHPARRRERDVRAHPVAAAGGRPEAGRQPLGEPALHAARRDRHDLRAHRVVERLGEQVGERLDQAVGPFGSMYVQHALVSPQLAFSRLDAA